MAIAPPTITTPSAADLSENKREMFDGMRAYHQSEISHANHAITMLLAIAAAAGAVVLAILFPQNPPTNAVAIAWGLFVVVSLLTLAVAAMAHKKIDGDHQVYAAYGKEYVKTSELLGFYVQNLPTGAGQFTSLKTNTTIGQGKGYLKTLAMIWMFAGLLIVLTFLFAVFVPNFV